MATAAMAYGERRFGASYTIRLVAGLMVVGFLFGIWVSQDNPLPAAHPGLMWFSIAVLAVFAGVCVVLGKSSLTISDAGVRCESAFGQQQMAWPEIIEFRYRVVPVSAYAHLGLIGALLMASNKRNGAQLTLELIGNGNKKLKVTSNYQNAAEAIGMILGRIMPPMVQNAKAKLQRGETVVFGSLKLSAVAVTWKNTSIPLTEITKAELVRSYLQLKRQGKWMAAVSVRSDKVPDVLVFLELLESLAPQLKTSGIDPLARVRM